MNTLCLDVLPGEAEPVAVDERRRQLAGRLLDLELRDCGLVRIDGVLCELPSKPKSRWWPFWKAKR